MSLSSPRPERTSTSVGSRWKLHAANMRAFVCQKAILTRGWRERRLDWGWLSYWGFISIFYLLGLRCYLLWSFWLWGTSSTAHSHGEIIAFDHAKVPVVGQLQFKALCFMAPGTQNPVCSTTRKTKFSWLSSTSLRISCTKSHTYSYDCQNSGFFFD